MKRVVILGAGFGGLAVARRLSKRNCGCDIKVTVVDRSPLHVFTPLLYEVATGWIEHENVGTAKLLRRGVTVENASLLSRYGADFIEGEVEGVDWTERRVFLRGLDPLPFDSLVIALGAETNFFGIEGMAEHASTLKSVRDAERLRQRIHDRLHLKERGGDDHLSVVIGGGGATGVEFAAELTLFLRKHLARGHLAMSDLDIRIVEATSRVLGPMGEEISDYAARRLKKMGVTLDLDTCVKRVTRDSVVIAPRPLQAGESPDALVCDFRGEVERVIPADLMVWTGGIRGSSALEKMGLTLDSRGQRVEVGPTLEITGHPNAFVIGDSSLVIDPKTEQPAPALAQAAIFQGEIVARTVVARASGKGKDAAYDFRRYPAIIPLGGKHSVARVGGLIIKGFPAWLLKEAANLRYFLTLLPPAPGVRIWWRGARMYSKND